ncbi:MAG: STAS domain-containing protein [Synergistaceae bacterium]|jgi:anti-anti-sigma factor|nr:STAS domain-containing protein [Synergistaceae bacterium]
MDINVSEEDGRVLVELRGRLDTNSSPELQRAADEILKDSKKTEMTIDFESVDFVSSAGLRVLLMLQKKLGAGQAGQAGQGTLTIKNLSGAVREVFDMTGFSSIFTII